MIMETGYPIKGNRKRLLERLQELERTVTTSKVEYIHYLMIEGDVYKTDEEFTAFIQEEMENLDNEITEKKQTSGKSKAIESMLTALLEKQEILDQLHMQQPVPVQTTVRVKSKKSKKKGNHLER